MQHGAKLFWFVFGIFQGLYVFSVFFVMHNQFFWPAKATYNIEMNGNRSPDSMYQGADSATVGGGEISKSTQNLISAMEEVGLYFSTHITRLQSLYYLCQQSSASHKSLASSNHQLLTYQQNNFHI